MEGSSEDASYLIIRDIVDGLLHHSIALLAVDFDNTLVDVHTCGKYRGTPQELANRVRPFFR